MRPVRMLFVSIGTDHHPFPRLLGWVGDWAAEHPDWEVQVQHGRSPAPPYGTAFAFCDHDRLQELLEEADAVVTHGGPATITEARRYGHVPIVVPRDPRLGEHVDAHQQLFARRLAAAGLIRLASGEAELRVALDGEAGAPTSRQDRARRAADRQVPPGVHAVGRVIEDLARGKAPSAPAPVKFWARRSRAQR